MLLGVDPCKTKGDLYRTKPQERVQCYVFFWGGPKYLQITAIHLRFKVQLSVSRPPRLLECRASVLNGQKPNSITTDVLET